MPIAAAIVFGLMGCGTSAKESPAPESKSPCVTAQPSAEQPSVEQPPSGQASQVQEEETPLSAVVAEHILPLTEGPWPESIMVTDREITFKKTGKLIPYHHIRYSRSVGEGETYQFTYDIPVCLPSGEGVALFNATCGCEFWGARMDIYDPNGRLLCKKIIDLWPFFSPDGEKFINFILGDPYEMDHDWGGVQLCSIDGTVKFDVQVEKAEQLIKEHTGNVCTDGSFYCGRGQKIWVVWDRAWEYFAFTFWAEHGGSNSRAFYLFIYSAKGNLVRLLPVKSGEDTDSAVQKAIDDEFTRLGTKRGEAPPEGYEPFPG